MERIAKMCAMGLVLAALALGQSHRVVPDQLTVPLNGTGTFQIVIGQGVDAGCVTTGSISASPAGVVNITPGLINFNGGSSGNFTVFGVQAGMATVTLMWLHSCPASPGDPGFSVSITRQLSISVPSAGAGKAKQFVVPAKTFLDTGIDVVAGETITVDVAQHQSWCWGGNTTVPPLECSDPNGTAGRPNHDELPVFLPGSSFGALVGVIGYDGTCNGSVADGRLFIGSHAMIKAAKSGRLQLGMNDRCGFYGDNSGSMTASVSVSMETDLGTKELPLTASVGEPFLFPIASGLAEIPAAGGFDYSFSVTGGSLPPGITLSPTGDLTGTPTAPGQYNANVHWVFSYSTDALEVRYVVTYHVAMTVTARAGPAFEAGADRLFFSSAATAGVQSKPLLVYNHGAETLTYTVSVSPGEAWLSAVGGGSIAAFGSGTIAVNVDTSGLAAGTYAGKVTIQTGAGDTAAADVILTVRPGQPELGVSKSGLTFVGAAGIAAIPQQKFAVLNAGDGAVSWTTSAAVLSGSNWLSVTPLSGNSSASMSPEVTVTANAANLSPGDYYGQIEISGSGVANSPQVVSVVFSVRKATEDVQPAISTSGLVFVGRAGGANPPMQEIVVTNVSGKALAMSSGTFLKNGAGWLSATPAGATIQPGESRSVAAGIDMTGLTAGVYSGEIAFRFGNGSMRRAAVVLVVLPAGASTAAGERQAAGCVPTKLIPVFTSLGSGFQITAAWPTPVEMLVVDDCGDPVSSGAARVSFSSADPEIALTALQNGRWSGTWKGLNQGDIGVTLTADAQELTPSLSGRAQITGNMQANAVTPIVGSGGAVSAGNFAVASLLAPGSLMSIYGQNFGAVQIPTTLPLPITLGGTEVALGGKRLPLLYTSDGQINAMIPFDLKPDTTYQLVVRRGTSVSVPEPVHLASSQPAAFLLDANGLGIVVVARPDGSAPYLAGPGSPAHAGDYLVIYCVGLGGVSETVVAGDASPFSPLAQTLLPVSVSIGGKPANVVFSGLTPGLSGLYQVNVLVPEGVTGPDVKVVLTETGLSSGAITIPIE